MGMQEGQTVGEFYWMPLDEGCNGRMFAETIPEEGTQEKFGIGGFRGANE